jgi:hypothetical protein
MISCITVNMINDKYFGIRLLGIEFDRRFE